MLRVGPWSREAAEFGLGSLWLWLLVDRLCQRWREGREGPGQAESWDRRGSCALGNSRQTFGSAFKNVSNREGRTESLGLQQPEGSAGKLRWRQQVRMCPVGPHFPCCFPHHDPAVRGVGALTYQADSRIPPGTQQRWDRSRWGHQLSQ